MLDTHRVIQIGLRGTGYALEDLKWGMDQVRRLFLIDEEITFVIVYSIYKITLFPFKSFLRLVKKSWIISCTFQGFRCVPARDCWHKSLVPLMEEVRQQMGDGPVYLTFDIDALDPAFAPGTGRRVL